MLFTMKLYTRYRYAIIWILFIYNMVSSENEFGVLWRKVVRRVGTQKWLREHTHTGLYKYYYFYTRRALSLTFM